MNGHWHAIHTSKRIDRTIHRTSIFTFCPWVRLYISRFLLERNQPLSLLLVPATMHIAVDEKLLYEITQALVSCTKALNEAVEREKIAKDLAGNRRLLNESEAMEYLRRDADTLLYYRKNGLPYYKCGRDVWYTKGDIDNWLASGYVNRRYN